MTNTWLTHVKKTMNANPGGNFKKMLKLANKTYKVGGKNRKKSFRKTRRRKSKRRRKKKRR